MDVQLPGFEGRDVQIGSLAISGKSSTHVGSLAYDEEVFVIAKARVTQINHKAIKLGQANLFARVHTIEANHVALLDSDEGARILEHAIQVSNDRFGVVDLFSNDDDGNETNDG